MRFVLPVFVHVAWIVPFVFGYVYAGFAALLLVALPYIKLRKFDARIAEIEERYPKPRALVAEMELREIRKTKAIWTAFTFKSDDED